MSHTKRVFAPCLVAGLLAVTAPAVAADGDGFHFWIDPIVFEVLSTDVDIDSAKFQEYRDLKSGFRLPVLRLYGESDDGNRYLAFRADNLDRDDARYTLDYGLGGAYSFTFDYNKIMHRFGNAGTLILNETFPGVLELSDGAQASLERAVRNEGSNINFDFLNGLITPYTDAAGPTDLALRRNRSFARLDIHKMQTWAYAVEVRHEDRNGRRPFAGSFGFGNSVEIYEPIDYETTEAEATASYNGDRGGLRFGYRHSQFDNDITTAFWDNPWFVTDSTDPSAYASPGSRSQNGSSTGFADLAADNAADMFFVDGRGKTDGGWRFSGNVSYNVMTQDDPLLPYTLNTAIDGIDPDTGATFDATQTANLPVGAADTEATVTNFNADVAKQLGEDWEIELSYRYYDYDNSSPRLEFPGYVRFHAVWEEIPRLTVPYSYTRDDLGLEVGWDATDSTSVLFSYHMKNYDREFREIEDADEDVFGIAVDSRLSDRFGLRASWETGDRSISEYLTEATLFSFRDETESDQLPGLRKFDEAAREFDDFDFALNIYPDDRWLVTLGATITEEDYNESEFGLSSDEIDRFYGEVSYTPGAGLSFYAWGDTTDRTSFQKARNSGGTPSTDPLDDWNLTLDEANESFGLGVTSEPSSNWTFDLSLNWSESDGEADFATPPGGAEVKDIDNYEDIELLAIQLRVDYEFNEQCRLGFSYLYEDYTIDSFNLRGLMPYLPSTLLLAANNGDYQADVYGVHFGFSF